ncbi:flavin reductase family protein [Chachezhania sediminis]|uniref:flavin reductase family protein n=1 Tax=Chachezhania sediminis TaxID=2599291 RepID=UPI00131D0491|nr:flavin reductase family protein [Chachezhania sediminis]
MFYTTADGHPFEHNPLTAIVSPRPIAWISTRSADGVDNLAPHSLYNLTAYAPPQLMFSSTMTKPDQTRGKDTLANIEATGVFAISTTEYAAREAVNASSGGFAKDVDEFAAVGIAKAECRTIDCPFVADAPATFECRLDRVIDLPGQQNYVVLGFIEAVHLRDDCIVDGRFEVKTYKPLARLGYLDFAFVGDTFEMPRPG